MMDLQTAQDISRFVCGPNRMLINAIKLLRSDAPFGLLQAKEYLEENAKGGEDALYKKLCEDFVQDKQSLLAAARQDLLRLQSYIAQLEQEIEDEDH